VVTCAFYSIITSPTVAEKVGRDSRALHVAVPEERKKERYGCVDTADTFPPGRSNEGVKVVSFKYTDQGER